MPAQFNSFRVFKLTPLLSAPLACGPQVQSQNLRSRWFQFALPADFHRSISIKSTKYSRLIGPSQLCLPLDIARAFTCLFHIRVEEDLLFLNSASAQSMAFKSILAGTTASSFCIEGGGGGGGGVCDGDGFFSIHFAPVAHLSPFFHAAEERHCASVEEELVFSCTRGVSLASSFDTFHESLDMARFPACHSCFQPPLASVALASGFHSCVPSLFCFHSKNKL